MKYPCLLFDADDTLFDFPRAEADALQWTLEQSGVAYQPGYAGLYSKFNQQVWREFERGETTSLELREKRFRLFFDELGLVGDLPAVSRLYLHNLALESRLKSVSKGSFVFFQSDPAEAVYLVWLGVIALRLENTDGRELVINEMGAGDCFGELAILTDELRSTSAEALVDSEVLLIPSQMFKYVLEHEPSMALHLLEIIARRLQSSSKREEALAFYDAQQRLARLEAELAAAKAELAALRAG